MRCVGLLLLALVAACGQDGSRPAGTLRSLRQALPRFAGTDAPERSHDPRLVQAKSLIAAGRVEEAAASLARLAPDDATGEAWFLLGLVHYQREQYALALEPFARALAKGPTFPKARQIFFLYGRCLQETGDLEAARAAYEADVALFPERGDGSFRLALLDFEDGRLADCEARARAALERFERPQDVAKLHALLADVHLARGDAHAARDELERSVETYPHYEALYTLSRVCARLGDEDAAERYLALHEQWRRRAGR